MSELLIGYARVSTDKQDLSAQRDGLIALGVEPDRVYVDHGLTGTHRDRPGLREALAACRASDTLVVTKLDRLARSLPDARDIADELTRRSVRLNLGGSVYDPTDPIGRLLFNVLAMVAEFESDLLRARTREGMKIAKAKGRLRGKRPKLTPTQEAHLVELHRAGQYSSAELAELFGVARSTIYRALQRAQHCNAGDQRLVTPPPRLGELSFPLVSRPRRSWIRRRGVSRGETIGAETVACDARMGTALKEPALMPELRRAPRVFESRYRNQARLSHKSAAPRPAAFHGE